MPVVLRHQVASPSFSLAELLQRSAFDEFLLVVPTKRRIRYFTRELIRNAPGAATPALPLHTLETLSRSLYGSLPDARRIVAGPAQTLLVHMAVKTCRPSLRYFRLRGSEPQLFRGTFDRLLDIINVLKESGVYPDLLDEEVEHADLDEQQKLRDVALIYRSYDDSLDALGAEDMGGLYKELSLGCSQRQFETAFRHLFPRVRFLSLAGFDEFTEPEIGVVRKLCGIQNLAVDLVFDFLRGNPGLFGHLEENYGRFRELGFVEAEGAELQTAMTAGVPERPGEVERVISHLSGTLFHPDPVPERPDLSGHITIVKAHSRTREIELICTLIKLLMTQTPERDLSTICVALYRPQLYTEIVREVFSRYGIPVNITDRFELARSPVVASILGLLQIPANNFRRDDVLRVAASPYLGLADGDSALDPSNLEEVSRSLRVVSGYRAWCGKIDRRLSAANARLSATTDSREIADLRREISMLARAREDIERLATVTREIASDCTPHEFSRHLMRLLDTLRVPRNLVTHTAFSSAEQTEKDVRAYTKFREMVEDVVGLLGFQDGARVPHPLRFYLEHLRIAASQERYNIQERFGQGVLVTSIEETRQLPIRVMIVAGLVDGEFPGMYQPEIFLSTGRKQLRELRHVWQNRYLFYQAATNWTEQLFLTYPESEGELDLVRSSFIDALLKVAQVRQLPGPSDPPFHDVLASQEDLLQWYGRFLARTEGDDTAIRSVIESLPVPQQRLDDVRHALEVERSRIELHSLPEYEGILSAALTARNRASLAAARTRTFSVSQLETYGRCPFRFFAQRVLHLKAVGELEEELTALEKGTVLHEVLFEFYSARRAAGLPPLSHCSDADFDRAADDLLRIAEGRLRTFDIPDAFWELEKQLILGSPAGGEGLLRAFLRAERNREDEARPGYFEVGFGSRIGPHTSIDPHVSREDPVRVGDVLLQGKVDRVDLGEGFFTIIDYKTGKATASMEDIRKGLSLQLPLYLAAIEQLLRPAHGPLAPAGGLYFQLKEPVTLKMGIGNGEFAPRAFARSRSRQMLRTGEELRRVLEETTHRVAEYVDRIARGEFPLTDQENIEKVCVFCEFKIICRIQSLRHVKPQLTEDV